MLDRGKRFYSKCLLLRALASEATRQVTNFLASCESCAIIIFRYFFQSTQIHVNKILCLFQVSDVSHRR